MKTRFLLPSIGFFSFTILGAVVYRLVLYQDINKITEIPKATTISYGGLCLLILMLYNWCSLDDLCLCTWLWRCKVYNFFFLFIILGIFVNRFLSWKGFIPLNRLTYCVYLIHLGYLNVVFA